MLSVENLTIRYGRVGAVHDVSLAVSEGEIVSVVGPNGAGKSSVLAAITGSVIPVAGEIAFEGASLVGLPPERIVRQGIALVPEGRHIFETMSVSENLMLGATVRQDSENVADDLDRVLDRFPILRRFYRSSAAKLSGGEQQQLAIARALLSRPRLLMLDEPSLGLAPQLVELVFEILAELREDGVTILLVEQNAVRAVNLADRAYLLRSGQVAYADTREAFTQNIDFASAYLGVES